MWAQNPQNRFNRSDRSPRPVRPVRLNWAKKFDQWVLSFRFFSKLMAGLSLNYEWLIPGVLQVTNRGHWLPIWKWSQGDSYLISVQYHICFLCRGSNEILARFLVVYGCRQGTTVLFLASTELLCSKSFHWTEEQCVLCALFDFTGTNKKIRSWFEICILD